MDACIFSGMTNYLLWADEEKAALACEWCELLGNTGYLSFRLLLRVGIIDPFQFIGVDLSEDIVRKHQHLGIRAVCGNLHQVLPGYPGVGVLNLRTAYYAVGLPINCACRPARCQGGGRAVASRLGEFCLLL